MGWRILKSPKIGNSIGRSSRLKSLVIVLSLILLVNICRKLRFSSTGTEQTTSKAFNCDGKRRDSKTGNVTNQPDDCHGYGPLTEGVEGSFACSSAGTQIFDRTNVLVLGKPFDSKVFLTVGIPTIERTYKNKTVSYIEKTLTSLIDNMNTHDTDHVRFIIFLSDVSKQSRDRIKANLKKTFLSYIEYGLIQVIEAPNTFYPQLEGLKRTFGDSQERMFWRSKQTMDYVFLFQYVSSLSQYYLQMEDDVTAEPNYTQAIKEFIGEKLGQPWVFLEFSKWGFIGKLFRSISLLPLARFMRLFYNELPCDWLLIAYRNKMGQSQDYLRLPELFHHIGKQSSSLGT